MTKEEVLAGAKAILDKRKGEATFKVLVDSPKDCDQSMKAFKALGCKVKLENDGKMIVVTRPAK
jgi:hypothetical protein